MKWWKETGEPSFLKESEDQWKWFEEKVLPDKCKELCCSLEEGRRLFKTATMIEDPDWHRAIQYPTVKQEVKEPRDQRWPASPKW
ncbi:hypothetical protein AGDE_00661 [Angomonas deanei]|nr:hypothetical protein AGDE_00661 [Angomonas deanei]|eukprot:EPY43261.1 hypothetical protein AGDE_00661 [Angomonas deanei]